MEKIGSRVHESCLLVEMTLSVNLASKVHLQGLEL